jgi:hypothetical protein
VTTLECAIDIRADQSALFRLTQDYDRRLAWDPFLKEARLVGGARQAGPGVRAWCVAHSGLGMETEYVSFREPDVVAVKMTKGPALLANFAGSWRFRPTPDGLTRVIFRYNLAARPRWLRFALDPVLSQVFAHDVAKRLTALKSYAETNVI